MAVKEDVFKYFQGKPDHAIKGLKNIIELKKIFIALIKAIQQEDDKQIEDLNNQLIKHVEDLTEDDLLIIANDKYFGKPLMLIISLCTSVLDFNMSMSDKKLLNSIENTEKSIKKLTYIIALFTLFLFLKEILPDLLELFLKVK